MQEARCEIVVLSKLGGVQDLKVLADGVGSFGRRRIPMLFEDEMNTRSNVDSINSMYEVSPFSSFGELIDLEDFLISHSKLEKYRKT